MNTIIRKWYWAWDFDKEEKWLNEMAAKGRCLTSVGFCRYEFDKCLPGEYNIRLELLEDLPSHAGSMHYISFMEEMGIECIGAITRWVYFRKKTADGPFDLFSDNSSRIKHLNRILVLIGIVTGLNITAGGSNLSHFSSNGGLANGIGLINGLLVLVLGYGFFRIYQKKRRLQKEQQVYE